MRQDELIYLKQQIEYALKDFVERKNISVSMNTISYIAEVISEYYRDLPSYLIDIKETSLFRVYKARGDISLLLVGFFNGWVNRRNRPLKEEDYISAGKLNYLKAYYYLDSRYGDILEAEKQKDYTSELKDLVFFTDLFKDISLNFEIYTEILKRYRDETSQLRRFYDDFNHARILEFEKLFKNI